jgi:hypothetical protein
VEGFSRSTAAQKSLSQAIELRECPRRRDLNSGPPAPKEIEERYEMSMDAGLGGKQKLDRQMKKHPKTVEWVLYYHFHAEGEGGLC